MDSSSRKDRIGRTIGRAARLWRRAVDVRLQAYGLTEATWLPLLHLSRAAAPMRQKDLAASLSQTDWGIVVHNYGWHTLPRTMFINLERR